MKPKENGRKERYVLKLTHDANSKKKRRIIVIANTLRTV